jgi:hypothetical protein
MNLTWLQELIFEAKNNIAFIHNSYKAKSGLVRRQKGRVTYVLSFTSNDFEEAIFESC